MPLTQHINEIEKKFEQEFGDNKGQTVNVMDYQKVRSFLRQSILSTLQAVKEEIEEMPTHGYHDRSGNYIGIDKDEVLFILNNSTKK